MMVSWWVKLVMDLENVAWVFLNVPPCLQADAAQRLVVVTTNPNKRYVTPLITIAMEPLTMDSTLEPNVTEKVHVVWEQ